MLQFAFFFLHQKICSVPFMFLVASEHRYIVISFKRQNYSCITTLSKIYLISYCMHDLAILSFQIKFSLHFFFISKNIL